MSILKRVLIGRPIATADADHQRLSKTVGLAVFSSDAISSTAYATQEILFVTAIGASSLQLGLDKLVPISIIVAVLLAIVSYSYRQTIFAYPSGGGSYVVSRENLGTGPSLVAGASLLVDYILTVAVSVSAGVAAITSLAPELLPYTVEICAGAVILLMLANLRGLKESGTVFAFPTYGYIAVLSGMLIFGLGQAYLPGLFGDHGRVPFDPEKAENIVESGGTLSLFILAKGFASGAVALTGIEAISNGVPAFRKPVSKNAATTMTWMAVTLGSLFFGVSLLASHLHPYPSEEETAFSQMGKVVFGDGTALYIILQVLTCGILLLAANTAYADFPRLASLLAHDGYLPRQLTSRGDRLVFSNGVLALSGAAVLLLVVFGGKTSALIPLYAVGVFTSFTLSQAGMVRHHLRDRETSWRRDVVINGVGAFATFVVLLVVAITKFTAGAWLSIVVTLVIISQFVLIRRHYDHVSRVLDVAPGEERLRGVPDHTVVVLVNRVHRGVIDALRYAKTLRPNHLLAVTVVHEPHEADALMKSWADHHIDIPLEVVHSPYRELVIPIEGFLDELDERWGNTMITVVLPEFTVRWFETPLHNQSAIALKIALLDRQNTVVTSVPYRVGSPSDTDRGT